MSLQNWIGRTVDTTELIRVSVNNGKIEQMERLENQSWTDARNAGDPGSVPWISPGWIDLQVNGFAGFDLNAEQLTEQDVLGVAEAMFACGVTSFLPTIVTSSRERLNRAFRELSRFCESGAWAARSIVGFHLEGPYISAEEGPRGAHLNRYVRDPELSEFEEWQQLAGGRIRMVTMAPERRGALEFMSQLAENGTIVAIGHTAATSDQITQAVEAGATMCTHLGNGSHPLLPRHPNYIWDQLADDRLWAGLIADGHHLPFSVLKVILRAKGDRAILVSDAVKFAGMPPGFYESATSGLIEVRADGRLRTTANPDIFAGSSASLADGVANAVAHGGVGMAEAIAMVTSRPAALMGLRSYGRLETGAAANLTLFHLDPPAVLDMNQTGNRALRIRIAETVLAGRTVYKSNEG